jgi:hypothetical protein
MTMPDVPSGRAPMGTDFGPEAMTTFPAATGAAERDALSGDGEGGSGKARAQMRQVKDQVVDQAKSSIRQARDRATSSLTESRFQAAEQIGGIATAFRRTGEHLRDENQTRVADFAESLAEQVERASSYLRDRDFGAVRQDLEGLARRQPAMVLGVGFALGLLGARFFKSSERQSAGGYDAGA